MKLLISLLVVIAPTVLTAPPTRHHHIHRHHYASSPATISFKSFQSSRRPPPSSTSSLHFPPTSSSSSNRPRAVSPSASTGYTSYETTLKLGPNEFLIPSSPQRPSLYDQDPASLVPGLIITRLAEDFARLTAQGLRSRETRIPVYVAVSEEDDDGLPTAKSIPKLVHLLDATSHRNKDTAQYEEVQPHVGVDHQSYRDKAPIESGIPVIELNSDNQASNPNVYQTPTISDKRPSTSLSVPSSPSSSNDDPTIAVAVASPVATSAESSVPSTSSQKEPTDNAAAKAELEVISKIHHLIEKQQETLFKQHVESVIKDHLVNLVKQQVNQALAQTSAGRGNQEASNRQTHYVDHITAANSQRHQPSTQLGKISVGEKANLHQHNAMYRPTESAESAESVDKVTAQMIHQIKGQLDQLNSQLNQTVAALPAPAPTPAPHKTPSPSALQLTPEVIKEAVIAAAKEAERRMWAEEQVRRMTEHLADGDLHAVEQRNLIHNIMHHFRRPRDIDDRSMEVHAHEEEETSLPNPSELYEYHREESSPNVPETISIPVVLLPQREADDVISHDRYHHEGDADAGHQQSNDEEDQDKKKKK